MLLADFGAAEVETTQGRRELGEEGIEVLFPKKPITRDVGCEVEVDQAGCGRVRGEEADDVGAGDQGAATEVEVRELCGRRDQAESAVGDAGVVEVEVC